MNDSSKKYYGVIGNPIKHSKSPAIHNTWFQHYGIDGLYEPYLVEHVDDFVALAKKKPLSGFNVTVPHKEAILDFCDKQSDAVKAIGAANTVVLEHKTGVWRAENTDYLGFLKMLKTDLKQSLKNKNIFLIGAGGSAKAILYALLAEEPQEICVVNRSLERAETLINKMQSCVRKTTLKLEGLDVLEDVDVLKTCDVMINSTSVGLHHPEDSVFKDFSWMEKKPVVVDILYQNTKLLTEAKKRECILSDGMPMLMYQAQYAFEYFTGIFPDDRMLKKWLGSSLKNS